LDVAGALDAAATPFMLRHPRVVQRVGQAVLGPLQHLFEHVDPKPGQYSEQDISPYFWHNGQYPDSDEYKALFDGNFADYQLAIGGLVEQPAELDLTQLRALPHHEQITQHFCIQGWSGIAKWGGVSMQTLMEMVKPCSEAKWVVFYSLGDGADKGIYYDAHPIEHMSHHLTMLAYDMNDAPLSFGHGAPLRLRNEIELGFKQVKWIKGIESSPTSQKSEVVRRLQPGPRVLRLPAIDLGRQASCRLAGRTLGVSGAGRTAGHERAEAVVIFCAGGAAAEVGGQGGHCLLCVSLKNFAVDVDVELLEAFVAGRLGFCGTEKPADGIVGLVGCHGVSASSSWPPASSSLRSLRRASCSVL